MEKAKGNHPKAKKNLKSDKATSSSKRNNLFVITIRLLSNMGEALEGSFQTLPEEVKEE